jgi:hypothetical protein
MTLADWHRLWPFLFTVGLLIVLVVSIFFAMTFTVDEVYVRVRVYGWTVRKVALSDIAWADQQVVLWNEHYTSSFDRKRVVRLRRRTGWIPNFIITPSDPWDFLRSLEIRGVEVRYPEA